MLCSHLILLITQCMITDTIGRHKVLLLLLIMTWIQYNEAKTEELDSLIYTPTVMLIRLNTFWLGIVKSKQRNHNTILKLVKSTQATFSSVKLITIQVWFGLTLQPHRVISIKFLLTISPLNQTLSSWEWTKWLQTQKTPF